MRYGRKNDYWDFFLQYGSVLIIRTAYIRTPLSEPWRKIEFSAFETELE